jgi:hypothetical protein
MEEKKKEIKTTNVEDDAEELNDEEDGEEEEEEEEEAMEEEKEEKKYDDEEVDETEEEIITDGKIPFVDKGEIITDKKKIRSFNEEVIITDKIKKVVVSLNEDEFKNTIFNRLNILFSTFQNDDWAKMNEFSLKVMLIPILIDLGFVVKSEVIAKKGDGTSGFIDLLLKTHDNKNIIIELKYSNITFWNKFNYSLYKSIEGGVAKRKHIDEKMIEFSSQNPLSLTFSFFKKPYGKDDMYGAIAQVRNYSVGLPIHYRIVISVIVDKVYIWIEDGELKVGYWYDINGKINI